MSQYEEW